MQELENAVSNNLQAQALRMVDLVHASLQTHKDTAAADSMAKVGLRNLAYGCNPKNLARIETSRGYLLLSLVFLCDYGTERKCKFSGPFVGVVPE